MKKINIFLISALAFAAASCDDKSDLGVIQTNSQETLMTVDGITITPATEYNASAINLGNYQPGDVIPMLTYTADATIPADAEITFDLELSGSDNYASFIDVPLVKIENQENAFGIKAEDWDAAFRSLLGKTPNAHDMYGRIAAYINIGKQHSRLGDLNTWLGAPAHAINVTPVNLNINTEAEYYLYGDVCGDDMSQAVKMNHSSLSQWDDTVWSLAFEVPAGVANFKWYVAPLSVKESGDTEGLFGVEDASAKTGNLVMNGVAGEITDGAGKYLLTVDMHAKTYTVMLALDGVWTPGNGNGWGFANGMLTSNDYITYRGYANLSGEFKIAGQPDWSPLVYGVGEKALTKETDKDGNVFFTGNVDTKGGNIGMTGATGGLYFVDFNVSTLVYTLYPVTTVGIIGGFEDNNWATDKVQLTPSEDNLTWTGEVTFTDASTQFKFRMNEGWTINLGGNGADGNAVYNDLVDGGGNLVPPGVGTYNVTLSLVKGNVGDTYSVTFTAK